MRSIINLPALKPGSLLPDENILTKVTRQRHDIHHEEDPQQVIEGSFCKLQLVQNPPLR